MLFMTLLCPKGKGAEAVEYLKRLEAPESVVIRDVYFTLGRYDGVIIFEAPDAKAAMKFAMQVGFATNYTVETLIAISAKEV